MMRLHMRPLTLTNLVLTLTLTLVTCRVLTIQDFGHFTNEFAVLVEEGEGTAKEVANDHGFDLIRKINNLNYYHLEHSDVSRRAKRSSEDVLSRLRNDDRVSAAHQQMVLERNKRDIVHDKQVELPIRYVEDKTIYERHPPRPRTRGGIPDFSVEYSSQFVDPYYVDQWYLHNEGQTGGVPGFDVNVEKVWYQGFTGKGVVVTVLDDGCDHTHPDLKENYDPTASTDLNNRKTKDPMPDVRDPGNSHGTRCVGEIAAAANNSVCGVGIAFHATYGCVRMLDGAVTDSLEAEAMSFAWEHIDIKSASWGPRDDGGTMEGPGPACAHALKESVHKGRNGKGTVFVWATGNGGGNGDMCGADGYVSSPYTLSIGCISDEGLSTYYSEVCAATMAVIFTGGSHKPPGNIEYRNPKVKVVTTDLNDDCTLEFQGTSSAAPLAAGCFALVLEANMNLTWRDMQHLVVHTARIPSDKEPGWFLNGAGFHVNPRFGFGAIDCGLMVELAQDWQTVKPQHVCDSESDNQDIDVPSDGEIQRTLHMDGCEGDDENHVNTLEHVEIIIKLKTEFRGSVALYIVTPMGTKSELLSVRRHDHSKSAINFTFMTVQAWGEDPKGDWTLIVKSEPGKVNKNNVKNTLKGWSLRLYGTAEDTSAEDDTTDTRANTHKVVKTPHMANKNEIDGIMKDEEKSSETIEIDPKTRELLRMLSKKGGSTDEDITEEDVILLARILSEADEEEEEEEKEEEKKVEEEKKAEEERKNDVDRELTDDLTDEELAMLIERLSNQQTFTDKDVQRDNTTPTKYRRVLASSKKEQTAGYHETFQTQQKKKYQRERSNQAEKMGSKNTIGASVEGLTDEEIDQISADLDELLRTLQRK